MQKTNFKTRLLALLTAVFMVVVSIPFAAFADNTAILSYYCFGDANHGGHQADEVTINASSATSVTLQEVKNNLPKGYVLVNEKNSYDIGGGSYVFIEVTEAKTKTIKINYYSESEGKQAAEVEMEVAEDATYVNSSDLTAPKGYELAKVGDFTINDGYVYVPVKPVPTTKTIKINYYSESEEKQVAEVPMEVAADATYVNSSDLTAPDGYELVKVGDFTINDGYVYVAVKPIPTTKTVKINYYSEEEEKQIAEVPMEVAADATYVNSSSLTAPDGYELVKVGDFTINDGYVYVAVRKVKAPATTKTIKINYYSEAEEKQIAEVEMEVAADATYINSSELTAPEGYKLDVVGDLVIRDGYVYAKVSKIGSKTVKINYYSEEEEKQIKEEELTVAPDATSVNTSKLTVPTGYELVEVGDLPIRDGYVYAAVRKVATKEVKINFYCPEEKKQISEPTIVVKADATYVNSSEYAALVPAGYELVEVGDMPIRDGYVYAEVRKVATKTIKINYYSEEEEKQIDEVEITVPADATYINTSILTAPAGYELCEVGDLPIRDGYVYAAVRKVPTTNVDITYKDEADGKEVGTEVLVVNQGTTVVNYNVLKDVPKGYELCECGDFYVGNGSAVVMVRKIKSNDNGSSSSSSSSSSNKTTTASSEQKVVKAAAAPANTTKVLPKTGASNVAPLLGGSLAVVALLMGYGVYSLVLRKKD